MEFQRAPMTTPAMDKASRPANQFVPTKKAVAKVALVDLNDSARNTLSECFRQFGIESVIIDSDIADHLQREKFEACVMSLKPGAEALMEAARTSKSNSRMIIYGMGGSAQDAMRYSKYGVNAVFHEPVERQSALKLVRATHTLVLHEFRRYVRIPVITEISVVTSDNQRFNATSKEISSGGMSMQSTSDVSSGQNVEVSFALLTLPRIWVRGTVTWRKGHSFGIRFDLADHRRTRIKDWIEAYLEN
ncbi:MAG TPA: PilZ domain-containing protein [Terriglobales bacterium]